MICEMIGPLHILITHTGMLALLSPYWSSSPRSLPPSLPSLTTGMLTSISPLIGQNTPGHTGSQHNTHYLQTLTTHTMFYPYYSYFSNNITIFSC